MSGQLNVVNVGDKAPNFSLRDGDGREYSLVTFRGKKIVLFFYPQDDTPTCTKEVCLFRDDLIPLKNKGAIVIGISPDGTVSHKKFTTKYGLNFPVLSDEERKVISAYGVWQKKKLFGRKYMGVVRTSFIINEKGIVSHIFPNVRVNGHTKKILKALSE